jgi:predicted Fe-Mo cluster-binding NifX family protein
LKIAVAAVRNSLDGEVGIVDITDMSAFWLVIDSDSTRILNSVSLEGFVEHSDPGQDAVRAALASGPEALVAVGLGPGALDVARQSEVKLYRAEKGLKVREAVDRFRRGRLTKMEAPTHAHGTHRRDAMGRLA